MALVIADRIKETTTTTGTGAISLLGAITGFRAFSAKCSVGDTCYYAIQAVDSVGSPTGEWECGLGTYSAANTLTRTTVTSSSNSDAAVNFSAGTKQVYICVPAIQAAWARERLTGDRTYYVRTDGSDSNNGLSNTSGGAFLTIQKAIDVVFGELDIGIYNVTIKVADGTYTTASVAKGVLTGTGSVVIQGNSSTPSNVVLNVSTGAVFTSSYGSVVTLKDMKITGTATYGVLATKRGSINFSGLDFGSIGVQQLRADDYGNITCIGAYTISGGALIHIEANSGNIRIQSNTITLVGTPSFSSCFVEAIYNGTCYINGNTFSGSAIGKRSSASANGVIIAAASDPYIPGSIASTTATGGQYI